MIDCLLVTLCFVLIIDQFHFTDEITSIISGWMTNGNIRKPISFKPFTCSLCMSWWTNLLYIIVTHRISIVMIAYILVLSWLTPIFNDIMTLIKQLIIRILNKIS